MGLSPLLDEIYFQKEFWDTPGMFAHYYKIILNFLYVCQSVSLLLPYWNIDKYGDISIIGGGIFLKFFETFLGHWFTSFYSAWLSLHIDFWSFCVLVLTLKPLIFLPFGSLVVSFWDLWSCWLNSAHFHQIPHLHVLGYCL